MSKIKYAIGTIIQSRQCGDAEIISRIDGDRVKIRFLDNGIEKVIYSVNIPKGNFSYKEYNNYKIGDIVHSLNSGDAEIIARIDARHMKVRFLDDGIEKIFETTNIANGEFSSKEICHYEIGEIVHSNNYGNAVIIEKFKTGSKQYRLVRFGNGNERIVDISRLKNGIFSDGSDKIRGRNHLAKRNNDF